MARISPSGDFQRINVGSSFNAPNAVAPITARPIDVAYRAPRPYAAEALGGLGTAVGVLASGLQRNYDEREATANASWFSRARAQTEVDWLQKEADLRDGYGAPVSNPGAGFSSPVGAGGPAPLGFSQIAGAEFEKYRDEVMKSAPSEDARLQFQQWADGYGANVRTRAFDFEEASLFAQRADDLNAAFDNHVKVVYSDPDRYDEVFARATDDLDAAAAWMTPEQEIEARGKVEEALQLARAKKLAQFDPMRFQSEVGLSDDPVSVTSAKIINAESRGNASAKNPNSSASGLGQFTDATWLATVRKHRPDLAGMSDKEVLTLKSDPALGKEMTVAHTRDNAAGLAAAGLPATEGNLYLAHFAGIGGARAVLTADDNASVVDVLGPEVVRANPFLQGKSVAWLKEWSARTMAGQSAANMGTFADNPKYSRLSPDQIFALAADANSSIVAQHNMAVAEQKAVYDAKYNSLMVGIHDGLAGVSDVQQARREGWLSDYADIKKAADAIEARDRDQIVTAEALARLSDPGASFNPFVEDDRDVVNTAYKAMGGATALIAGDEVSIGRLTAFVERTDIIPGDAVAELRGGMQSRDPEVMAASFAIMDGLYRNFPAAADRAFDETSLQRLQRYQTLAPMVPIEEMQKRLDPGMDPTTRRNREEMRKMGLEEAGKVEVSEILDAFDPGMFSAGPEGPIDGPQASAMSHDFNELYAEFYADHGNADAAKTQALEALQRKWGATDTGPDSRIVAYPPERRYPMVDGDHDWMGAQLEETVLATDPDAQDWGVTIAPETEGAWSRGDLPPYYVVYTDANGIPRTMLGDDGRPLLFQFDYETARGVALEEFEQEAAN